MTQRFKMGDSVLVDGTTPAVVHWVPSDPNKPIATTNGWPGWEWDWYLPERLTLANGERT